jgi:serine/threonine-protein kinase mTOR
MTSTIQLSQIDLIFQGLKNKNVEARLHSAEELRSYVNILVASLLKYAILQLVQLSTAVAEMPPDAAAKLWDDNINRRLFELTHSQNPAEAYGGLVAIGTSFES